MILADIEQAYFLMEDIFQVTTLRLSMLLANMHAVAYCS
jgi:hypothetical protein